MDLKEIMLSEKKPTPKVLTILYYTYNTLEMTKL